MKWKWLSTMKPSFAGSLDHLTELYVGDNQLSGIDAIPPCISRLSELTVFHASGNANLEDIPIEMKVMNQIQEVIYFGGRQYA